MMVELPVTFSKQFREAFFREYGPGAARVGFEFIEKSSTVIVKAGDRSARLRLRRNLFSRVDEVVVTWLDFKRGKAVVVISGVPSFPETAAIDPGSRFAVTLVSLPSNRVLRVFTMPVMKELDSLRKIDKKRYLIAVTSLSNFVADLIVDFVLRNNVARLVFGDVGNSDLVFADVARRVVRRLENELRDFGVEFVLVDEYRTSRVDAIAGEDFSGASGGRRVGALYVRPDGTAIDADVNGALNIMRKAFGDEVIGAFNARRVEVFDYYYRKLWMQEFRGEEKVPLVVRRALTTEALVSKISSRLWASKK